MRKDINKKMKDAQVEVSGKKGDGKGKGRGRGRGRGKAKGKGKGLQQEVGEAHEGVDGLEAEKLAEAEGEEGEVPGAEVRAEPKRKRIRKVVDKKELTFSVSCQHLVHFLVCWDHHFCLQEVPSQAAPASVHKAEGESGPIKVC